MKLLIKPLIVCLLTITSIHANINNNNLDKLVEKLNKSEHVSEYLENSLKVIVFNSLIMNKGNATSNDTELFNTLISIKKKTKLQVYKNNPELLNLQKDDLEYIFSKTTSGKNIGKCLSELIIDLATCAGGGSAGTAAIRKFEWCMSAAVAADAAEEVATDGAATPILAEELVGESRACLWLAGLSASGACLQNFKDKIINRCFK